MKTAKVTWIEGMQFVAEAGSGHAIVIDGEPASGGRDTGTRPMELVLEGLAGCTAMDVIHILRRKRQDVTGLEVKVEGERADTHPKVYTRIHITYIVRGRQLSEKAVHDAVNLSKDKYCSVSAMLKSTADISYNVIIEDADNAEANA
ncbi:MAG: OsmC family protein [candidate division KSB1 bacterium]|nr:OsmC family protein [candidate division KSB1 bacterium]MDQ7062939.1 OsmC family protein [candidate division KSB1 bacterium]